MMQLIFYICDSVIVDLKIGTVLFSFFKRLLIFFER